MVLWARDRRRYGVISRPTPHPAHKCQPPLNITVSHLFRILKNNLLRMKSQPKNFDSLTLCFALILKQEGDTSYCKHSYLNKGATLRQHRIKLRKSSCNSNRNCWARNRVPAHASHCIQKRLGARITWEI
jgi:hypothetical protein